MPQVMVVTSEKGGVGKSTLSIHLAGALADRGLGVLLIDEDGRVGSSLKWAQRAEAAEYELGFVVRLPDDVKDKHLNKADVVIIDTEGHPKRKKLRQWAQSADQVLIPSGLSPLEIEATHALLDFLDEETQASSKSRVILTRVPPTGHAPEEVREDLRDAGAQVCNTMVRQYAAYLKAAEHGWLCRDVPDPKAAQAWQDIVALSHELR